MLWLSPAGGSSTGCAATGERRTSTHPMPCARGVRGAFFTYVLSVPNSGKRIRFRCHHFDRERAAHAAPVAPNPSDVRCVESTVISSPGHPQCWQRVATASFCRLRCSSAEQRPKRTALGQRLGGDEAQPVVRGHGARLGGGQPDGVTAQPAGSGQLSGRSGEHLVRAHDIQRLTAGDERDENIVHP